MRGTVLRWSCFVESDSRHILPALGAYTGGISVLDSAFAPLNLGDFRVPVRGRDKVSPFLKAVLAAWGKGPR